MFGARAAEDVRGDCRARRRRAARRPRRERFALPAPPHVLREAMTRHVGLERDAEGLREALAVIARLETRQRPSRRCST